MVGLRSGVCSIGVLVIVVLVNSGKGGIERERERGGDRCEREREG